MLLRVSAGRWGRPLHPQSQRLQGAGSRQLKSPRLLTLSVRCRQAHRSKAAVHSLPGGGGLGIFGRQIGKDRCKVAMPEPIHQSPNGYAVAVVHGCESAPITML